MNKRHAKADEQSQAFVRRLPFFRALDPTGFEQLMQASAVRVLAPMEDLFMQDEEGETFTVLLSGKLEIYRVSSDGEETLIRILDRGEAFASGMTLAFSRHPFCARAIGAVRALIGPRAMIVQLMRENGAAAVDFASSVSGNLKGFADHIEELRALPALDRLRAFLRRLGTGGAAAADLSALPYKKIFIARAIGVTPETLSRLLAKMRAPLGKPLGTSLNASCAAVAKLHGFDLPTQQH